jgi:hypothetical protein
MNPFILSYIDAISLVLVVCGFFGANTYEIWQFF